jgi:hypothetical protein
MTGVKWGWYKLYLYKFSFNTKGDTSRCFVLQCTAASVKVEPCSDDEIRSLSSRGEDEEEHLMPLFMSVMKCELKASYILMSCPFCKSIYRQSLQKYVSFICAQAMCTNNKRNECDFLCTDPERIGKEVAMAYFCTRIEFSSLVPQ